jgi:hypothetical protein
MVGSLVGQMRGSIHAYGTLLAHSTVPCRTARDLFCLILLHDMVPFVLAQLTNQLA